METISEKEVVARRVRAKQLKQEEPNLLEKELSPIAENSVDNISIKLETEGRFNTPETILLRQFKGRDVNNIVLTKPDKLLNSLIVTLKDCVIPKDAFAIESMLSQEFLELMIGIKSKTTSMHTHRWVCDCQSKLKAEDQVVNETVLDMKDFKYKSISEADEKLRELSKPIFDNMSNDEFISYKMTHYSDLSEEEIEKITKEDALKNIKISEPIKLKTPEHVYEFRFNRIGDLLFAHKESENTFASKFKQVQNKKWDSKLGISLQAFKTAKESELEELEETQAKYAISVYQAAKLLAIDGREISSLKERIELYDNIPEQYLTQFNLYIQALQFGLQDERDFECPLCGNQVRRSLQREFDPVEFLSIFDVTSREYRHDPRCSISIGI